MVCFCDPSVLGQTQEDLLRFLAATLAKMVSLRIRKRVPASDIRWKRIEGAHPVLTFGLYTTCMTVHLPIDRCAHLHTHIKKTME